MGEEEWRMYCVHWKTLKARLLRKSLADNRPATGRSWKPVLSGMSRNTQMEPKRRLVWQMWTVFKLKHDWFINYAVQRRNGALYKNCSGWKTSGNVQILIEKSENGSEIPSQLRISYAKMVCDVYLREVWYIVMFTQRLCYGCIFDKDLWWKIKYWSTP